jgi:hypothetical protein
MLNRAGTLVSAAAFVASPTLYSFGASSIGVDPGSVDVNPDGHSPDSALCGRGGNEAGRVRRGPFRASIGYLEKSRFHKGGPRKPREKLL